MGEDAHNGPTAPTAQTQKTYPADTVPVPARCNYLRKSQTMQGANKDWDWGVEIAESPENVTTRSTCHAGSHCADAVHALSSRPGAR